jgi:hypothetical protein
MATMMSPRERWTDDRLDDLNKKVDDGFARLDHDIRELRGEVRSQGQNLQTEMKEQGEALRTEIKGQGDSLGAEMKAGFEKMNSRFDTLYGVIVGALVATIAASQLF